MEDRNRDGETPLDIRRELLDVLFAHRRPAAWTALAIVLGAAAIALFAPRRYEVSAWLLVKARQTEQQPESLTATGEGRALPASREDLNSEIEVLCAPPVLEEALRTVAADAALAPFVRGWTASGLRRRVVTEVMPASNVIRIQMTSRRPRVAAAVLNALLDAYLHFRTEVYDTSGAEEFFSRQIEVYQRALQALDRRTQALTKEHSVTLPEKEMENNVAVKRDLMTRLQDLKVMELGTQADLYRERQSMSNKIVQLAAELAAIDARNIELQRQANAMQEIRREAGVIAPSYEVLLRKREEARLARAIQDSALRAYVSTLGRAHVRAEPVFPPRWLLLAGLLAGLAAGCSVAMLLEFTTDTIRRPADVERAMRLPVLFSLPKVRAGRR